MPEKLAAFQEGLCYTLLVAQTTCNIAAQLTAFCKSGLAIL